MLRLKSYFKVPPGSFRYNQHDFGLHVSSNIEQLADELMDWRKGNNKERATFGEALEDIENFTVAHIGANSGWVYNTDKEFRVLRKRSNLGCSTCGASVT
jgi:hypothetical protein